MVCVRAIIIIEKGDVLIQYAVNYRQYVYTF